MYDKEVKELDNEPKIDSSLGGSSVADGEKDEKQQASHTYSSQANDSTLKKPKTGMVVRRRRRRNDKNVSQQIPELDPFLLNKVVHESGLPVAYSFEIPKTVRRIVELRARHVALQMPEGLLMYATVLADVLQRLSQSLEAVAYSIKGESQTSSVAKTEKPAESAAGILAGRKEVKQGSKQDTEPFERKSNVNESGGSNESSTARNHSNEVTADCGRCAEQVSVLGDVTYGACCVGDLDAQALGADLLVHYGHSCLVPMQHTVIPCLYVFVEIQIDIPHLVESLHATLEQNQAQQLLQSTSTEGAHAAPEDNVRETKWIIYLLGTIQFRHCFTEVQGLLRAKGYDHVLIPQVKPLSPGEVLGCTSPKLALPPEVRNQSSDTETCSVNFKSVCCFVADGRFHLESTMISNPHVHVYYRYDPYSKVLTTESYAHEEMKSLRWQAIQRAKEALVRGNPSSPTTFGILLGTLGRQGNPAIVQRIRQTLSMQRRDGSTPECSIKSETHASRPVCRSFVLLLSEITPAKLALLDTKVHVWVQVACPRLSVDWGHYLAQNQKPVLTPYELMVALEETSWQEVYPMDYYAQTGGPWSNYHGENHKRQLDALGETKTWAAGEKTNT